MGFVLPIHDLQPALHQRCDGMGQQLADWHAGLKMHRWSNSEATKFLAERTEFLFTELIAGEDINYMPATSIEWSK